MTRMILVFTLLLSAHVFGAESIDESLPESPFLLRFTDTSARAMHLPLLRAATVGVGNKEVRIWIGFGTTYPEQMIRFEVQENGMLKSESYLYYPATWEDDKNADKAEVHASVLANCTLVGIYQKKAACKKEMHDAKTIQTTFDQLTAIGMWDLPGGDDIPKYEGYIEYLDGIGMIVEMKSGDKYRAYEWSNPGFDRRPEARKAQAIMTALKGF